LLITRLITAVILAGGITTIVLLFPTWVVSWVIALFWLGGAWEWTGLLRLQGASRVFYMVAIATLMFLMAFGDIEQSWAYPITVISVGWWMLSCMVLFRLPRHIPLALVGAAGPLVLIPSWFLLSHFHQGFIEGPQIIMSLLLIVWAADVGAYLIGSFCGKVKLAPRVSPGKTWEGFIGGIAFAGLVSFGISIMLNVPKSLFVAIGVATAMSSVLGDLTISFLKRNVNIKDSGRLLPGHGGILDRIDSLTAATPIFALGMYVSGLHL
jgi:phosphatidate cytidylyltransferase